MACEAGGWEIIFPGLSDAAHTSLATPSFLSTQEGHPAFPLHCHTSPRSASCCPLPRGSGSRPLGRLDGEHLHRPPWPATRSSAHRPRAWSWARPAAEAQATLLRDGE